MNKMAFYNADIKSELENKPLIKSLLESLFKTEGKKLKKITYVFCSDEYLLTLNQNYLNHKTLTDVITFPLSEITKPLVGEIYISIERVKENAKLFHTQYQNELLRVMIHGALHLCGYSDKKKFEVKTMRQKENFYLNEFKVSREANK
jgi:probable rRNA maturation factor